jgi:glycerophosphoryl diester phosphodiesterase
MSTDPRPKRLFSELAGNWRQFLLIHIAINVVTFMFLAPLATLLLHLAVSLSGDAALSDQDILFYAFRPVGLISLLLVASIFSVIVFLEYAALMAAAYYGGRNRPLPPGIFLTFLARRAAGFFGLALRILSRVLLVTLPFLLVLAAIYWLLLGEYDIYYHIRVKPPQFIQAVALAAAVLLGLVWALVNLFVDWVFALPLLLINGLSPAQAMSASKRATRGRRMLVGACLLGWLMFALLLVSSITWLLHISGNWLIPLAFDAVNLLVLILGLMTFVAFVVNFFVSWLNVSLLSLLILDLYRSLGLEGAETEQNQMPAGESRWLQPGGLLTAARLSFAAVAGVLIATLAVNDQLSRLRLETDTYVIAHRGASFAAPENTIAAVEAAIEAGADWVEIDVQEAGDGNIVVLHDSDLRRIAGEAIAVSESTLEELQQPDIGSWFSPQFSDQRVPSLTEILSVCKGRIGVNIELKYYGGERRFEQSVIDVVEAAGMHEEVVLMSLSQRGLMKLRALRPGWDLGLLSSVALGNIARLDMDFLAINARFVSPSLVRQMHETGGRIYAWTINDPVGMAIMASRGVDGIITDEPALAVSVLEQHRALDPVQKLLIQATEFFNVQAFVEAQ